MKYFVFDGKVYKTKKSFYEYFGIVVSSLFLLFPSYFFGSVAIETIQVKNSVTAFSLIFLIISIIPLFFVTLILTSEILIDVENQVLIRSFLFGKLRIIVPLDHLEKIVNITKLVNGFYVGTYIKLSFKGVGYLNRNIYVKNCFGDKVATNFLNELNSILSIR